MLGSYDTWVLIKVALMMGTMGAAELHSTIYKFRRSLLLKNITYKKNWHLQIWSIVFLVRWQLF